MGSWYGGYVWGENVACVPGCPNKGTLVLDLWWRSPGHQANILNPAFGLQGVGVTCNGSVEDGGGALPIALAERAVTKYTGSEPVA